jgi:hypothetical protein
MAGVRRCEQCGAAFVPRREHARFCSGHCRVVLTLGDSGSPAPAAGLSALEWSVTAMNDLAARPDFAGWPSGEEGLVTTWAWPPAARPAGVSLPPDGQLWELSRYHAYQEFVAGRSVGKVSRLAVDFLARAAFSIAPGAAGAAFIQYG